MQKIAEYSNGGTLVTIYDDGTKVRKIVSATPPVYPESIDCKITNWCDAACKWCHEKSTKKGKHANLQNTVDLLKQLPAGVEIAVGGGHALSHPDFENFVKELSNHGLVCSVTVNEKHFEKELPRLEKLVSNHLIYGIGYSYSEKPCTWKYEHLVSHVIAGVTSPEKLAEITKVNNKVLLLGYKTFGRGEKYKEHFEKKVEDNIAYWYRYLFKAAKIAHLSFDNLAITQLKPERLFANKQEYNKFYMGNDGRNSMYINSVEEEYAISSISTSRQSFSGKKMRDVFANVRLLSHKIGGG